MPTSLAESKAYQADLIKKERDKKFENVSNIIESITPIMDKLLLEESKFNSYEASGINEKGHYTTTDKEEIELMVSVLNDRYTSLDWLIQYGVSKDNNVKYYYIKISEDKRQEEEKEFQLKLKKEKREKRILFVLKMVLGFFLFLIITALSVVVINIIGFMCYMMWFFFIVVIIIKLCEEVVLN